MHGFEDGRDGMISYVSMEKRIPEDHPLRAIQSERQWWDCFSW